MKHYNISINEELAEIVEKAIKEGLYSNKSEFFRELIRKQYLENEDYQIEAFEKDHYHQIRKTKINDDDIEYPQNLLDV